jgi:putative (di)nucleoside polyphosphate hydrolase
MSLRPGVVAVFTNKLGQVLLFERTDRPGIWQFPQGGVEEGETFEDALTREVREEVGILGFKVLRKSEETTNYLWPPATLMKKKNHYVGQEHTWFLVELDSPGPVLEAGDGSFTRFEWVSADQALERNLEWKRPSMSAGLRHLGLL